MTRRIMFVTGDVAGTDAERFLEETGSRWLAKPFRLKDLLRAATGYGGVSWLRAQGSRLRQDLREQSRRFCLSPEPEP